MFSPINKRLIQLDHVMNMDRVDCFKIKTYTVIIEAVCSMDEFEMRSQERRQEPTWNPL